MGIRAGVPTLQVVPTGDSGESLLVAHNSAIVWTGVAATSEDVIRSLLAGDTSAYPSDLVLTGAMPITREFFS